MFELKTVLRGLALDSAVLGSLLSLATASIHCAPARLVGTPTFGTPDQPFGTRRPVTAADRALIQRYRAKQATFSTNFSDPAAFQMQWKPMEDDKKDLKSCRRKENIENSNVGLRLKTLVASDCNNRWSTASIITQSEFGYGFYETTMKIADIKGMNNAIWLTTEDHYEIDIGEVQYPNYSHLTLQYWPVNKNEHPAGVGFGAHFSENLSWDFHDYGLLWTPTDLVFEVDGEPIAAVRLHDSVKGPANIRLSSALADWALGPVPDHPEGHNMVVRSLRFVPIDPSIR